MPRERLSESEGSLPIAQAALRRVSHPPAPEHAFFTLDADAAETSLARIRAWDFDRIVLAHGTRIEDGGKAVFEQIADSLVARARKRWRVTRSWHRAVAAVM